MGEQAVREPVVYDFGVSSRLSREAVLGMRKIHTAAADELEFALSRAFGTEIKATSVEVSQVRNEAFVAMAPTLALMGLLIIEVRNIDASETINSFISGIAISFVGVWVVAAVLESLYLAYSKSAIENTINDALSAVSDTPTASPGLAGEARER